MGRMPDGDFKVVWKEQLSELQRDLKDATERMLSRGQPPTNAGKPDSEQGMMLQIPGAIRLGRNCYAGQ